MVPGLRDKFLSWEGPKESCFSNWIVPRMIKKMTAFKFKPEVIFIICTVTEGSPTKLSFQNWNNFVFSYGLCWFPVCPALGVVLWWRGKVAGPRIEIKFLSTLSALLSRREERLWYLPGRFLLGSARKTQDLRLCELQWLVYGSKSKLKLDCGPRWEADDAQGSQIDKSWPRKYSSPVWAF